MDEHLDFEFILCLSKLFFVLTHSDKYNLNNKRTLFRLDLFKLIKRCNHFDLHLSRFETDFPFELGVYWPLVPCHIPFREIFNLGPGNNLLI